MVKDKKIFWIIVNTIVILYALIPVLWIVSISLKPVSQVKDGRFIPKSVTWENYRQVLSLKTFRHALFNSLGVGLITTFITVIIASLAAYAVVRYNFRGKKLFMAMILIVNMFPQISLVTPLFGIEKTLGLFDTWMGLILPCTAFALPLALYTIVAFFHDVPWELEQAAKVDGATTWQAFRKVISPMVIPGLVTAAILVFIFAWNDLLLAMSLTSTDRAVTAPTAIANFTGANEFEEPTGSIAAAAVIITIPIILFVLFFQKKIISGLTSGAVKG